MKHLWIIASFFFCLHAWGRGGGQPAEPIPIPELSVAALETLTRLPTGRFQLVRSYCASMTPAERAAYQSNLNRVGHEEVLEFRGAGEVWVHSSSQEDHSNGKCAAFAELRSENVEAQNSDATFQFVVTQSRLMEHQRIYCGSFGPPLHEGRLLQYKIARNLEGNLILSSSPVDLANCPVPNDLYIVEYRPIR